MLLTGLSPLRTGRPLDEIKDIRGELDVVRLPGHLRDVARAVLVHDPGRDPDNLDEEKPLKNVCNDDEMARVSLRRVAHEPSGKDAFPALLDQVQVVPGYEFTGLGCGRSGLFRVRAFGKREKFANPGPQLVLRVRAVIEAFAIKSEQMAVLVGCTRVGAQEFAHVTEHGAVAGFVLASRKDGSPEVGDLVEEHIAHGVEAVGGGKRAFELDRPGFRVGDPKLSRVGEHDVGPRRNALPDVLRRFFHRPGVLPAKAENKGP